MVSLDLPKGRNLESETRWNRGFKILRFKILNQGLQVAGELKTTIFAQTTTAKFKKGNIIEWSSDNVKSKAIIEGKCLRGLGLGVGVWE